MPCSDYGPNDTIHEQSARIKDLTKVACDLLRALRRGLRREDGARVDWKDGLSSYTMNGEAELAYFLEVVRLHVVSRFVERWVTDEKAG